MFNKVFKGIKKGEEEGLKTQIAKHANQIIEYITDEGLTVAMVQDVFQTVSNHLQLFHMRQNVKDLIKKDVSSESQKIGE